MAEDIAGICMAEGWPERADNDAPTAPATLPVIARGEEVATMRMAVVALRRMVDHAAATGDALARELDEEAAG